MEWPEKRGILTSMVDSSPLTNKEKMGHLKGLVNGKAKKPTQDSDTQEPCISKLGNFSRESLNSPV